MEKLDIKMDFSSNILVIKSWCLNKPEFTTWELSSLGEKRRSW